MKRVSFFSSASFVVALLAGGGAAGSPVAAQLVGYSPAASPYRDLPYKQELSAFAGYMWGGTGRIGVAPGNAPLVGLRYELRIGGPATLILKYTYAPTDRRVLDPTEPPATRDRGTQSAPTTFVDVGIGVHLTGQRTWHHLTPVVALGAGVATDRGKQADKGGFTVGTPFAFNVGGGIRYAPGGSYALRVDITDNVYKINYPASYKSPPGGGAAILPLEAGTGQWLNHKLLTVGVSRLFGR
ncbi:MAG: hypothetical protein ABJD07_05090 [Gemmatimonadaceae bacterium]